MIGTRRFKGIQRPGDVRGLDLKFLFQRYPLRGVPLYGIINFLTYIYQPTSYCTQHVKLHGFSKIINPDRIHYWKSITLPAWLLPMPTYCIVTLFPTTDQLIHTCASLLIFIDKPWVLTVEHSGAHSCVYYNIHICINIQKKVVVYNEICSMELLALYGSTQVILVHSVL